MRAFPVDPKAVLHPPDALVEDYRALQRRIGTTRNVHHPALDLRHGQPLRARRRWPRSAPSARMVAVVDDTVTDAELKRMHGLGVRGIRFNLAQAGATTPEMIEPLARRDQRRSAGTSRSTRPRTRSWRSCRSSSACRRRSCSIISRISRSPTASTTRSSRGSGRCIDKGRTWVKLSGAYLDTKAGPPAYADATAVARAYVKAAPERLRLGQRLAASDRTGPEA